MPTTGFSAKLLKVKLLAGGAVTWVCQLKVFVEGLERKSLNMLRPDAPKPPRANRQRRAKSACARHEKIDPVSVPRVMPANPPQSEGSFADFDSALSWNRLGGGFWRT